MYLPLWIYILSTVYHCLYTNNHSSITYFLSNELMKLILCLSTVFDCETVMKYWSLNNVGFFDLWQIHRNKKRGLSGGRDKQKDILIKLYFVLSNRLSKAGKYFSTVQEKECVKSSDVDFINLNSGTGCAIMLKTSCVSVFESMMFFKSCTMNELHVPNTH